MLLTPCKSGNFVFHCHFSQCWSGETRTFASPNKLSRGTIMKTVTKSFKSVSLATLILCVAATTAFAGQHSFSANTGRGTTAHSGSVGYNNSRQVQANHNGASGRYQTGYTGAQAGRTHGGNGQVQATHSGTSVRTHAGSSRQTHENRHRQAFSF
jgi:hypothetical protein